MEERLEELYRKLARHAASMIPVEWEEFHYLGEVEPGKRSYSSVLYFRDAKSGEFEQSNQIPKRCQVPESDYLARRMDLNSILLEICQCFADNEQKLWEQLSLSVDRSGKLNLHYDVMGPSDGGQLAREAVWACKTFGQIPEEGTASKRYLDAYRMGGTKTVIVYIPITMAILKSWWTPSPRATRSL